MAKFIEVVGDLINIERIETIGAIQSSALGGYCFKIQVMEWAGLLATMI